MEDHEGNGVYYNLVVFDPLRRESSSTEEKRMEIQKKVVGRFAKKSEFLEGMKLKIVSYTEKPSNFKENETKSILSLEDKEGNSVLLEINNTNVNTLIDLFGTDTDDWEGKLVRITSTDEGEKEVEGVLRQCFSLSIQRG